MIVERRTTENIKLTHLWIQAHVRFGNEDMPYDFPFRHKDSWTPVIELDTGRIVDWPQGKTSKVFLKVCDEGRYHLMDDGMIIETISGYVPDFVPNQYGDYIDFIINADGVISNWDTVESVKDMIEEYLNKEE